MIAGSGDAAVGLPDPVFLVELAQSVQRWLRGGSVVNDDDLHGPVRLGRCRCNCGYEHVRIRVVARDDDAHEWCVCSHVALTGNSRTKA